MSRNTISYEEHKTIEELLRDPAKAKIIATAIMEKLEQESKIEITIEHIGSPFTPEVKTSA